MQAKKICAVMIAVAVVISVSVCSFALLLNPDTEKHDADVFTVQIPYATQATEGQVHTVENDTEYTNVNLPKNDENGTTDEISPEEQFLNMLNLNYCYGDAFKSTDRIAISSAISLCDYAVDIPGYGINVSKILVEGFIKSFYGEDVDLASVKTEFSPEGFIALPCYEVGTQNHSIISVTETATGQFEVVSSVTFIYGGYDAETYTAVSHFAKSTDSEYGFNLLDCTLL